MNLTPHQQQLLDYVRKLPEDEQESTLRVHIFAEQAFNESIRESNKWEEVSRVNMQQLSKEWDLKYEHQQHHRN